MKTDNIRFFISLDRLGLKGFFFRCNNITFSSVVDNDICLNINGEPVSSFSSNLYDLVFHFESDGVYFYDLVKS